MCCAEFTNLCCFYFCVIFCAHVPLNSERDKWDVVRSVREEIHPGGKDRILHAGYFGIQGKMSNTSRCLGSACKSISAGNLNGKWGTSQKHGDHKPLGVPKGLLPQMVSHLFTINLFPLSRQFCLFLFLLVVSNDDILG